MVGGLIEMDENYPAEAPAWTTYFIVEDADATTALAAELGGAVRVPPFDAQGIGRLAVLGDPHGARFAVMSAPAQPDE